MTRFFRYHEWCNCIKEMTCDVCHLGVRMICITDAASRHLVVHTGATIVESSPTATILYGDPVYSTRT